jgi:peptidoglycan/xylan/chitin deacetylase (PgdA/CDA1 family)
MMSKYVKRGGSRLYFGSVKFFKHIITIIVILLVLASFALVAILTIENQGLKEQLAGKESVPTGGEPHNPEPHNPEPHGQTTTPDTDDTAPTEPSAPSAPTEPEWPPVTEGDLFPELYAQRDYSAVDYTDDSNTIYLTFDDGPNYHTTAILNYLNNCGVKATFFVVPSSSTAGTLRRIRDEGHGIAVHSYTHEYTEIYASVEAFLEDFNKARNMIHEQTGIWSDIYRFPGGSINSFNADTRDDITAEMNRRGFVYFDWNVDSRDTSGRGYDLMFHHVPIDVREVTESDGRAVVLFHDSGSHTSWVITDLIRHLQRDSAGYTFAVINEHVRPVQW